jgi:hypothetical protein
MLVASRSEGRVGRAGRGRGKGNGGIFGGRVDEKTHSVQTLARRHWAACQMGAREHGQMPRVVGGRLAAVEVAVAAAFGGTRARAASVRRWRRRRCGNARTNRGGVGVDAGVCAESLSLSVLSRGAGDEL